MRPEEEALYLSALAHSPEEAPSVPTPRLGIDWSPKLNPVQKDVYDDESIFMLSYGERGCVSSEAVVYTPAGLRRFRRLPASGSVFSFFGSGISANGFENLGPSTKPPVLLELEHGNEQLVSRDHPLYVCAEDEAGSPSFGYWTAGRISELREKGWRFWTPLIAAPEYSALPVSVNGVELDEELGYLVGALVGDGSLNKIETTGRTICFTNADSECIEKVRRSVERFGSLLTPATTKNGFEYRVVPKRPLSDFLISLGINKLSYYKRVPDQIVESPRPVILAFLRGLYDTDGTVEKTGHVSFTSTSKLLVLDIQSLLTSLGILSIRRFKKSASGKPTWNLYCFGRWATEFGKVIGFSISRKQARIKDRPANPNKYSFPPSIRAEILPAWKGRTGIHPRDWHRKQARLRSTRYIPSLRRVLEIKELTGTTRFDRYLIGFAWVEVVGTTPALGGTLMDMTVPASATYLADGLSHHNSGKTVGALHKLVKHCYNNFNALAIIIVGVKRQAKEGGAAEKLFLDILPQWKEGIGIEYTDWKSNTAKDDYLYISNKFGGWSRVLLLSMPVESYVRDRSKGLEPSFILVDEAQTLESDAYFSALVQQLGRRPNITDPQQYIACCNPEGPSNWVYKRFFIKSKDEDGKPIPGYSVHHVPISDNEKNLPPGYYDRVKEALKDDDIEYRRLVLGEWIDRPSGTSVFGPYFSDSRHLRGDEVLGTRILPNPKYPITIGYDLGTANSAVVFTQNIPTKERDIWIVFDELIFIDSYIPYTELVPAIMRRIQFWNDTCKTKFFVEHISDSSAFNQFRATHGTYDAWEVERISRDCLKDFEGQKPIIMVECPKPPNSVQARVKVLIRALQTDRFFISTSCKKLREMFLHLETEKLDESKYSPDLPFKPRRSRHLHGFDALSYPMFYYELDSTRQFLNLEKPAPEIIPVGTR